MNNDTEFYKEAFARNLGLISDFDQEKLRSSRVAVAGLGGAGGIYVTALARLGVGKMNITDLDVFEIINTNRQPGAFASTMGKPKAEVMEDIAKDINPYIDVRTFPEGINDQNIDEFLEGVKVVMDGIDFFNIDTRRLLFKEARKRKIPVVICAPIGFGACVLNFTHDSMSFDEYFDINDSQSKQEKLLNFGIGLAPSLIQRNYYSPKTLNLKDEKAPSSAVGIFLCANMATTEVFKILTGIGILTAPWSMQFDPYVQKLKKVHLRGGNNNIVQRIKKLYVKRKFNL